MNKTITYLVIALVAAAAVVLAMKYSGLKNPLASPTPTDSNGGRICTLEVKLCPDGSSVGRVGPNCDFAPCPTPRPTSAY